MLPLGGTEGNMTKISIAQETLVTFTKHLHTVLNQRLIVVEPRASASFGTKIDERRTLTLHLVPSSVSLGLTFLFFSRFLNLDQPFLSEYSDVALLFRWISLNSATG